MNNTFNSLMNLFGLPYDEETYRNTALQSSKRIKDLVRNNKTISGSFDKLNEDEQQKVVDSFNKANEMFSEFFGIKSEPYTKEDFAGADVSVTTNSTEDKNADDVKNTCKKDCKKNEQPKQTPCEKSFECKKKEDTKKTICENLYDEYLSSGKTIELLSDEIVNKVVSILKNKENPKYTIISAEHPTALVRICLKDFDLLKDNLDYYTNDPSFKGAVAAKLKKETGSPYVDILTESRSDWKFRIYLK